MVKKLKINEDFDQRLNYLMKQYGAGWLCIDKFSATLSDSAGEFTADEWDEPYFEKVTYVTLNRVPINNGTVRAGRTQSNDIIDDIIKVLHKVINEQLVKNVPLRFIAKELFILDNAVTIYIPMDPVMSDDYDDDYDESQYEYPGKYNPNGDYVLSLMCSFKLNDKEVKGNLLSLLTGLETV